MTTERLEARWINDQYVAQPETTADEWYSTDGDEWVNQDGKPIESPEFDATIFVLVGGPRDGDAVRSANVDDYYPCAACGGDGVIDSGEHGKCECSACDGTGEAQDD